MNYRLPNPTNPDYRNNYDKTFSVQDDGTTCPDGDHNYPWLYKDADGQAQIRMICTKCGHSPLRSKTR